MAARSKDVAGLAGSGDDGTTGLLGGGRLPKDDPQIEAYGTVDEASSAVGLAKATTEHARVREICEELQRGLYTVAAVLATRPERAGRYAEIGAADVARLDALCDELQAQTPVPTGFVLPGTVPASAQLDVARAVARRAERRVTALGAGYELPRRWLNRLSLLLWLLGRFEEELSGVRPQPAKA